VQQREALADLDRNELGARGEELADLGEGAVVFEGEVFLKFSREKRSSNSSSLPFVSSLDSTLSTSRPLALLKPAHLEVKPANRHRQIVHLLPGPLVVGLPELLLQPLPVPGRSASARDVSAASWACLPL
jgi:hypothetical protein